MTRSSGKRVKATARVRLEVEIAVPDSWGADCQVSQIHMQAAESARSFLAKLPPGRMRVVGEPHVSAVLTEEELSDMPVLNAWGDPGNGAITVYERARSGAVVKRLVKGEFISYLAKRDCSAELLRALRNSRNVSGLSTEGEWVRVCWRSRQGREDACDPETGWFARQTPPIPTYEADVPTLRRWMVDSAVTTARPRRVYVDIETCARFPFSQKEESRILCWTLGEEVDATRGRIVAQGMLERDDDVDEARLLREFWAALDAYDQVLAWNGDNFDFPVLMARSKKARIQVDPRRWLWLDHLELFRRMNVSASESGEEKQNMSLNSVATAVLREGKTEGVTYDKLFPWWQAGGEKRQALLDYNARDVELMCRIEARTGYVELLHTLCEVCGVFADTHGIQPMPQVESFMLRLGKERGVHFKTRKRRFGDEAAVEGGPAVPATGFKGAFVMEPNLSGIGRDVHVADFSSMYPSIILSFNMSPDTLFEEPEEEFPAATMLPSYLRHLAPKKPDGPPPIPAGYARAPLTGALFMQEPRGLLPEALDHMLFMRKDWSAKQAALPPGTTEWVEAGRRSTAYKVAANAFFGVVGARVSRLYEHQVAESITQVGVWLIRQTIAAAQAAPWNLKVVYGDTDSIFVTGCTAERFREFVAWCNEELYPRLLKEQGCARNTVKIAYEKQFDRIVFVTAKRYVGRYAHYKGKAATADSRPEIKGIEYKRGDAMRLARRLQAEVIDLLLGGGVDVPPGMGKQGQRRPREPACVDTAEAFVELVKQYQAHVLSGDLSLADIVLSKKLAQPLKMYASKQKKDGTDAAQPPHVRVAKIIEARGGEVRPGTRIEYVVVDGTQKPAAVVPAGDWTGEADRYEIWEGYVWPPTERFLQAAFPGGQWKSFGRVRPAKARAGRAGGLTLPGMSAEAGGATMAAPAEPPGQPASDQGSLFSLTDLGSAPLSSGAQRPRRRR